MRHGEQQLASYKQSEQDVQLMRPNAIGRARFEKKGQHGSKLSLIDRLLTPTCVGRSVGRSSSVVGRRRRRRRSTSCVCLTAAKSI